MFKRFMLGLMLAAGLLMVTPSAEASAWGWSWWSWGGGDDGCDYGDKGSAVPELDPSAGGSALVLLLGGVAYIASRRREEEDLA